MKQFEQDVADALALHPAIVHGTVAITSAAPRIVDAIQAAVTKAWNMALVSRGHISPEVADKGWQQAALAALRGEDAEVGAAPVSRGSP